MTALTSPSVATRSATTVALTVIVGTVMIPLDVTVVAVPLAPSPTRWTHPCR